MSVTDQTQEHRARCLAPLISLRMLAQGEAGVPLPRWVVVEVAQATGMVLAEAEAAVGVSGNHPGDETFLRVRLDRLAAAADRAIAAARAGDSGEMRAHLRRFGALTLAMWTVQDAVCGSRRVSAAPAGRAVDGVVDSEGELSYAFDDNDLLPAPEHDESPITHSQVASGRLT